VKDETPPTTKNPEVSKTSVSRMPMPFFNNRKMSFVRESHHNRKIVQSHSLSSIRRSGNAGMPMYIPSRGPGCGACGRH